MATSNITVTHAWTQVALNTDDAFLLTCAGPALLEVAATAADAAPIGIVGHRLPSASSGDAITRDILGAGYVWVRCMPPAESANVVVTK